MIVEVQDLEVRYKENVAVNKISFGVEEGEIFGIIGPNGAGKTSTIECIVGLKKKYFGSIKLFGKTLPEYKKNLYNLIGVQLQEASFPDKMKVVEICKLFSSFYNEPIPYGRLLKDIGMEGKSNSYVRDLSGGQKQRLSIILALIPNPKIIFLDELTTGLDPQARHNIWDIIKKLKMENKTIILTTHFMDEAEYLCDKICILINGKIEVMGTLSEILLVNDMQSKISFNTNTDLKNINFDIQGIANIEQQGSLINIFGIGDNLLTDIVNHLNNNCVEYRNLTCDKPKLEDVFMKLTGRRMEDV